MEENENVAYDVPAKFTNCVGCHNPKLNDDLDWVGCPVPKLNDDSDWVDDNFGPKLNPVPKLTPDWVGDEFDFPKLINGRN